MTNKIQDLIINRKKELVIAVCILILILLISIFMIISGSMSGSGKMGQGAADTKIDPKVLWVLEEPLRLPPIQFSREQRKMWDRHEVEFWYEPPSKEIMEMLDKKNKNLVDNILEAAP